MPTSTARPGRCVQHGGHRASLDRRDSTTRHGRGQREWLVQHFRRSRTARAVSSTPVPSLPPKGRRRFHSSGITSARPFLDVVRLAAGLSILFLPRPVGATHHSRLLRLPWRVPGKAAQALVGPRPHQDHDVVGRLGAAGWRGRGYQRKVFFHATLGFDGAFRYSAGDATRPRRDILYVDVIEQRDLPCRRIYDGGLTRAHPPRLQLR